MTAETPTASTVHHPLGKKDLWHVKGMELPAYIQNVAHALLRAGRAKDQSQAIAMAVAAVKKWASGQGANRKGHTTPDVQSAAAKAVAEWEAKKARAHSHANRTEGLEMANEHHDGVGKFTGLTKERARILRIFQEQHQLPVTGTINAETKARLQEMNKAAND